MANLLEDGYALFNTLERTLNDGNENCKAVLYATDTGPMTQEGYDGATGQGTHAEMNALDRFLRHIRYNHHILTNYVLEIDCTSKSCCKNWSAVLGLFGVHPHLATYKVNKAMGSTQWCLPPAFRDFLVNMGYARRDVNTLCGLVSL